MPWVRKGDNSCWFDINCVRLISNFRHWKHASMKSVCCQKMLDLCFWLNQFRISCHVKVCHVKCITKSGSHYRIGRINYFVHEVKKRIAHFMKAKGFHKKGAVRKRNHIRIHQCFHKTRGPWATSLTWETSSNQWLLLSEVMIIYIIKLAQ